ncbi:unnamed protein product [Penicillium pancosmium]
MLLLSGLGITWGIITSISITSHLHTHISHIYSPTGKMTTTTTTAASTSSTCIVSWQIPSNDVACAGPITGNMTDVFDSCCKGNSPVKYNDGCNIYCLAQGQTKKELSDCLTDKSKKDGSIFCGQGKDNSTATASATTTRETGSDATGTSTTTGKGSSTSTGAAIISQPISKTGLGLVAMLFCSAVAGVIA